jgi:hypothetical protein
MASQLQKLGFGSENVAVEPEIFSFLEQTMKQAPIHRSMRTNRRRPLFGTKVKVMGKLVDSRVDEFFLRAKVLIVEENLTGFGLIKAIYLFTCFSRKQKLEVGGVGL